MYKEFTETNPAKWQELITKYMPDGVAIAEVVKGGVIFFETMDEYYEWKAKQ